MWVNTPLRFNVIFSWMSLCLNALVCRNVESAWTQRVLSAACLVLLALLAFEFLALALLLSSAPGLLVLRLAIGHGGALVAHVLQSVEVILVQVAGRV